VWLVGGFGALLLSVVMATGCVPTANSSEVTEREDFLLMGLQLDNARFEPFLATPYHSFLGPYWLVKGEAMALRYDTFELHWQRTDVPTACTFFDNTQTNDCQVCDFCAVDRDHLAIEHAPCFGTQPVLEYPNAIVSLSNFFRDSMPFTVRGLGGLETARGCAHRTDPVTFVPEKNAIFQLRIPLKIPIDLAPPAILTERAIHVVEPQQTVKIAYQLKSNVVDGRQYWQWSTEDILVGNNPNPFWWENFSSRLHVSEVRFFKGTCERNPNTAICEHRYESIPVRPSRVQFIPNFTGSISTNPADMNNRCYQDPNHLDVMNLDFCRGTFNPNTNLGTTPKFLTPTFEMGNELQKLTWFAEFNINEGGDFDIDTPCNLTTFAGCEAPNASEPMIIEFTLVAM
jgi:hypothetical protein